MIKGYILHLIKQYGQFFLFIGIALESIGLPVPADTILSFAGYLSSVQGRYTMYVFIAASVAGAFTGAATAYSIGRRFGKGVLLKYGRYIHIDEEKLDRTIKLFNRQRALLLLFGRFVPGLREIVPYIAGISRMSFMEFWGYNMIGGTIWAASFIYLGYILGERWTVIEKVIKTYSLVLLFLVIFIYIVYRFFNRHKWAIFAAALPMLLFIKLCEDLIKKELSVFDKEIYLFIAKYISEGMTDIMKYISFLGSGVALVVISAIVLAVLWHKRKYSSYGRMILINLIGSSLLNQIFKILFHRPRPDILRLVEISGYSFPSGHSMTSMSFYGFFIYLSLKHMKHWSRYTISAALCLLVIAIGISRIYLGVHYASDVLAGFSAGLAWLALFITFSSKYCS